MPNKNDDSAPAGVEDTARSNPRSSVTTDELMLSLGFFVWAALNFGMVETDGSFNPLAHSPLALFAVSLYLWASVWQAYRILRGKKSAYAFGYGLFSFVSGGGFGLIIGAFNKAVIMITLTHR